MSALAPTAALAPQISALGASNHDITLFIAFCLRFPTPLTTPSGLDVYQALGVARAMTAMTERGNAYYDVVSPSLRRFAWHAVPDCDAAMRGLVASAQPLVAARVLDDGVRTALLAGLAPFETALGALEGTLQTIRDGYAGFENAARDAVDAMNKLYSTLGADGSVAASLGLSAAQCAEIQQTIERIAPNLPQSAQLASRAGGAMTDSLAQVNTAFAVIAASAAGLHQDIADLRADLFSSGPLAAEDLTLAATEWANLRAFVGRIGF
jgi:hypothetical protein